MDTHLPSTETLSAKFDAAVEAAIAPKPVTLRGRALADQIERNFPAELKKIDRWVGWRWEQRKDKWTKPPIRINGKGYASSTDPKTWSTFDAAIDALKRSDSDLDGIGLVFVGDDDLAGVDVDRLPDHSIAAVVLKNFAGTYCELSPSGKVHAWAYGIVKHSGRNAAAEVEVYDTGRYFTVTGYHIDGTNTSVTNQQAALDWLHRRVFEKKPNEEPANPAEHRRDYDRRPSDEEILEVARNAAGNGAKFAALFDGGNWECYYESRSEADLWLCSRLAFYFGRDRYAIDRMFRQSALMREKWNREDYRNKTLTKSLAGSSETYSGSRKARPNGNGGTHSFDPGTGEKSEPRVAIPIPPERSPPEPLAKEGFCGLAGEIVDAVEPNSEGDPAAILIQLLVAFGNAVGRGPYFQIEATRHYANSFAALVGETSMGRKGTSLGWALEVTRTADATWSKCIANGLSSGEGLIDAVRDARYSTDKKTGEQVLEDEGVADKRLLVIEEEFSSVLKNASRRGNILTNTLRAAWDGKNLRSMVRNSPNRASGAHISVIGHITKAELLNEITANDTMNGFANRYIWPFVKRSKSLPFGGNPVHFTEFSSRLSRIIQMNQAERPFGFSKEAASAWQDVYPDLTKERPGIVGALLARGAPIVRRFAMTYSILSGVYEIDIKQLMAALAIWEYNERSVQWVFGDSLHDSIDAKILGALRCSCEPLTNTDLHNLFNRNYNGNQIIEALGRLQRQGLVLGEVAKTPGKSGRPKQLWIATN